MDNLGLLMALGILLIFGLLVWYMIRSERRARDRKAETARTLGFTPFEPDPALVEKISQLYHNRAVKSQHDMRNVSRKVMPDAEMYLFDLVETSGEEDSRTEDQAVGVRSPHLNLPVFTLYPQADMEGAGVNFANKVLRWVVTQAGDPVDFPEHPEFQRRYLVSSPDPQGTRAFMEETKIRMLAQTRLYSIHAGGDIFIFDKFSLSGQANSLEALSERVGQAIDVFQIFSR